MESNICSTFGKISGITESISEFRGVSAISENRQVDKNKVISIMLKNPRELTNEEKDLLSYVEKVLGKDEYAELKEQTIKGNNGQGIADNLKLKFGDTRYGPLLELANNIASLGLVTHGGDATIKSAHNFSEDLFSLIKGEGNKGVSNAGPYSHLEDSASVGAGKDFTAAQKNKIIEANKERNGGVVKSDLSGQELVKPSKSQKGITPPENEWQVDHINPKDNGGSNSYSNAQVLSRKENRAKWNK